MHDVTIVKSVDTARRCDIISLADVERLQKRYQSASGQQNSVIGEVFTALQKVVKRSESFEQRLSKLENR